MELYFTDHCGSAKGRLRSDMISQQSGERCAMQVQRSQGMEREGNKGGVQGLLCDITSYIDAMDEKSMKKT